MIRMPLLPLHKHKMLIKLSIRRRNEAMFGSKVSKHILHNLLENTIMKMFNNINKRYKHRLQLLKYSVFLWCISLIYVNMLIFLTLILDIRLYTTRSNTLYQYISTKQAFFTSSSPISTPIRRAKRGIWHIFERRVPSAHPRSIIDVILSSFNSYPTFACLRSFMFMWQ